MSLSELLVIFIVALVVFGPDKLPELARNLGKVVAKGRRLKQQIDEKFHQQDLQLQLEENLKKAEKADQLYKEPSSNSQHGMKQ